MICLEWKGFWTVEDCRTNSDHLFIYGDNEKNIGRGGQAVIRYEPNAFGIPTKKAPYTTLDSYYLDQEFSKNKKSILDAISIIISEIKTCKYEKIVFPSNGLGTGLAMLDQKAPKTFKFLNQSIECLKEFIEKKISK